jgi:hypothetical protein
MVDRAKTADGTAVRGAGVSHTAANQARRCRRWAARLFKCGWAISFCTEISRCGERNGYRGDAHKAEATAFSGHLTTARTSLADRRAGIAASLSGWERSLSGWLVNGTSFCCNLSNNFSWITGCNVTGSGFGDLLARLKKLDRLPWHHCRNFLLVHELRMRVPLQYDAELIEPSNDPLQPNTIYQKDGDRRVVFEDMIQKHVLNVLRLFRSHEYPRWLFGAEPAQFVPTVSSARTKPPRCRSEDRRALAIHKARSASSSAVDNSGRIGHPCPR